MGLRLWRGFRLGGAHVGSGTARVSVTTVPTYDDGKIHVWDKSGIAVGGGVGLGLLEETRFLPGFSFTAIAAPSPRYSVTARAPGSNTGEMVTVSLTHLHVVRSAWRLGGSKRLGRLSLAAGFGEEKYACHIPCSVGMVARMATASGQSDTAATAFFEFNGWSRTRYAGAKLDLHSVALVGEFGQMYGGGNQAYPDSVKPNVFGGAPTSRSRTFAFIGVRLSVNPFTTKGSGKGSR